MAQSRVGDVDDAFQLLLTIIALVLGTMKSNYQLLYPEDSPERIVQLFIRLTVIPILIITFIWIAAKLIQNSNYSFFFKLVDWIMAMNLTVGGVFMYFRDTGYLHESRILETYVNIIMMSLVPLFVYFSVVPRYKEMYPNASLFDKKWVFIIVFIIAELLWFSTLFFAVGSIA